jgi:hypothetical protein
MDPLHARAVHPDLAKRAAVGRRLDSACCRT